ncbi:MAG: response regulator, partial [Alphaproteobacteria bacterium]
MAKFKVLIADDEELLQDIYEMILDSEFACDFIKVSDGESAIAALEKHPDINVIISDYNMPKRSGGSVY